MRTVLTRLPAAAALQAPRDVDLFQARGQLRQPLPRILREGTVGKGEPAEAWAGASKPGESGGCDAGAAWELQCLKLLQGHRSKRRQDVLWVPHSRRRPAVGCDGGQKQRKGKAGRKRATDREGVAYSTP